MTIYNSIEIIKQSNINLFLVSTGGGAGLQKIFWETPGTSSFLVGSAFPYSTSEFDLFLGYQKKENYCSMNAAIELAMAAFIRAEEFRFIHNNNKLSVGLAITAACSTTRERKGHNVVFLASCTKYGVQTGYVRFDFLKDRIQEGNVIDLLGLNTLLITLGKEPLHIPVLNNDDVVGNIDHGVFQLSECVPSQVRELFFKYPFFTTEGFREERAFGNVFMPGSFNPFHDGHYYNALKFKEQYNTIPTLTISTDVMHKKALTVPDMLSRVAGIHSQRWLRRCVPDILFTQNDPLFLDKVRQFPRSEFVIGYDTAVRMLDPKWGPEILPMLDEMRRLGTRFYVCGRVIDGVLYNKNMLQIPMIFSDMFYEVLGTGTDHSSTAIREKNGTSITS